jgi:prephenate dehydrogenase
VGQGVRDVTRIAAGEPALWTDIVRSNAPAVAAVLREVQGDLARLLSAVEVLATGPSRDALHVVTDLLERGAAGAVRPGRSGPLTRVQVVLKREPGVLARLLADTAPHGVTATLGTGDELIVDLEVPAGTVLEGWDLSPIGR